MKKQIAIGSACAVALGLAACTPPAEGEGEATPEETVEAVEETVTDGTMTGETDPAEGEGEGEDTDGVDADGNPIDR